MNVLRVDGHRSVVCFPIADMNFLNQSIHIRPVCQCLCICESGEQPENIKALNMVMNTCTKNCNVLSMIRHTMY